MTVPSASLPQKLCLKASRATVTPQRLREALVFSSSSFDGLLSYALTGDPMAEYEAAAVKPFAKQ
jgi:hypothetical protein